MWKHASKTDILQVIDTEKLSGWDVRETRKKPFSRLSGVFDSIGAVERCLEFIEFVIFGLGVKRAPVCCRKPPRLGHHLHHRWQLMCRDNPEAVFFLKHSITHCVHYSSAEKLIGYLLCQFSHKRLIEHKKVTQGYNRKVKTISESVSVCCQSQIQDFLSCKYWPPTPMLDQSKGLQQWLNISDITQVCDRFCYSIAGHGKMRKSDRDFAPFYCH